MVLMFRVMPFERLVPYVRQYKDKIANLGKRLPRSRFGGQEFVAHGRQNDLEKARLQLGADW
jgi:hypothetical protein